TWSPTVVLICRSTAYVWQSGRDAQFSADCGRTCQKSYQLHIYFIDDWDTSGSSLIETMMDEIDRQCEADSQI
ncbi:hypothetical protein KCU78_g18625, partial [Aureobasidium melanogenum]